MAQVNTLIVVNGVQYTVTEPVASNILELLVPFKGTAVNKEPEKPKSPEKPKAPEPTKVTGKKK